MEMSTMTLHGLKEAEDMENRTKQLFNLVRVSSCHFMGCLAFFSFVLSTLHRVYSFYSNCTSTSGSGLPSLRFQLPA
eukprot:1914978-Amphidinium_carterae.1